MADRLSGKRVAILVAEGIEQVEVTEPRKVLRETGAEVVRGCTLTSFPSLRTDLENAGAPWQDREVVTSRRPGDLPAFNRKMGEEIAEGVHAGQGA